jgi:hypothetical protein
MSAEIDVSSIMITVPTSILELMPPSVISSIRTGLVDYKSAGLLIEYYKRYEQLMRNTNFYYISDCYNVVSGMCVKIVPVDGEDISTWWFLVQNGNTFTIIPCKFISNQTYINFFESDPVSMSKRFMTTFRQYQDILIEIHSRFLSKRWITSSSYERIGTYEEASRTDLYV